MRRSKRLIASLVGAALCLSAAPVRASEAEEKAAIRQVIADMEAAWNKGDFRGYMVGFLNPDVAFVSRGKFQRDWQGTLDHYVADYGASPHARGDAEFLRHQGRDARTRHGAVDRSLPS